MKKEYIVFLHRRMWMDMMRDLGNCPIAEKRVNYKNEWCKKHFPHVRIENNCFLCEYTKRKQIMDCDDNCPIVWAGGSCMNEGSYYKKMLISELLAQPMRKDD